MANNGYNPLRESYKDVIKHLLDVNHDEGKSVLSPSVNTSQIAETLHDDPVFIDKLMDFMQEFVNDYGENYGL